MKGLDSILSAADPVNIAQRRQALAEMQFEQQYGFPLKQAQAQYQMATLPMRLAFFKKYGYEMPTTPGGLKEMRELQNQDEQARRHAGFSEDGGGGGDGTKPGTEYTQGQYERAISPEVHDIASSLLSPSEQPAVPTPVVPQIYPQTGGEEGQTTTTDVTTAPPNLAYNEEEEGAEYG